MSATDEARKAVVPLAAQPEPIEAKLPTRSPSRGLGLLRWVGQHSTSAVAMVCLFGLWEIASRLHWLNPLVFPPFSRVVVALYDLGSTGELWHHVGASLRRGLTGFSIAIVFGISLGLLLGSSARGRRWLNAPLEFFRQVPPLAILPALLLILGIGFRAQVAMVIWAAIWPIMLNTINGCRQVDPTLVKAARAYGAGRFQLFGKVIIPAALPNISTGLRLGGTYSLLVLVGAEMVGAQSGIGYLIISSQYNLRVPDMYAGILTLAILGLILNVVLLRFEARMSRWRDSD